MDTSEYFKERFEKVQAANAGSGLARVSQKAFNTFNKLGIPATRNEEWKYTRINSLFNKGHDFPLNLNSSITKKDLESVRLPGSDQANELFFINGKYSSSLSNIQSLKELVVIPLEEASKNEYKNIVSKHLGRSSNSLKDGINALNTAFLHGAAFIYIKENQITEHPVYIYNITDATSSNTFSQPRSLVFVGVNAQVQMVQTFAAIGQADSFTNEVMEIVVEKDARLEYYKIQNEASQNSSVSTTDIHQVGKSYTHTVTISLDGGIVRNNLNMILDAEFCESHLYGLYFQQGQSHIDNHTLVDNVKPNCYSNQLYKGIMDGNATGVFNGKIFVQRDAQKTNAYQSNKNILLSDLASVNTKPQLEILADDVKCSHGCTVGRLDDEGLFYLQSRGITEKNAKSLLLHAYADDILDKINLPVIRNYIDKLISERLDFDRS
ncbi:MAG: Fe-S cluster assembly protein SufD [Chitinophagaceae bacterium]